MHLGKEMSSGVKAGLMIGVAQGHAGAINKAVDVAGGVRRHKAYGGKPDDAPGKAKQTTPGEGLTNSGIPSNH